MKWWSWQYSFILFGVSCLLLRLVYESLQRRNSGHLQSFQASIKTHISHVNQRQARVMKYGQTQTIHVNGPMQMPDQAGMGATNGISSGASGKYGSASVSSTHSSSSSSSSSGGGYAMFATSRQNQHHGSHVHNGEGGSSHNDLMESTVSSSNLRRRNQQPSSSTSNYSSFGGAAHQVQSQINNRNDTMYRQSQKVEKSIAQMGKSLNFVV